MADSLIQITIGLHEDPTIVAERVLRASEPGEAARALKCLGEELIAAASGVRDAKVLARVDSVTRGAAAQTVVVESDDTVVDDTLLISIPGYPTVSLVAVEEDTSVVAGDGTWSIETATDTAQAASLALAINNHTLLRHHLSATEDSGTITITALLPGEWAHGVKLAKSVTTAGALTLTGAALAGGDDVLDQPTLAIVFGSANITANDTISVGAIEYTWVASASAVNEITLSTTEATAAANFAAKINADTRWTGLMSASVDTATVTLTWLGDPRAGQHALVTTITEVNSGSVAPAGTALVTGTEVGAVGTTITGSSTTRTYGSRGAA